LRRAVRAAVAGGPAHRRARQPRPARRRSRRAAASRRARADRDAPRRLRRARRLDRPAQPLPARRPRRSRRHRARRDRACRRGGAVRPPRGRDHAPSPAAAAGGDAARAPRHAHRAALRDRAAPRQDAAHAPARALRPRAPRPSPRAPAARALRLRCAPARALQRRLVAIARALPRVRARRRPAVRRARLAGVARAAAARRRRGTDATQDRNGGRMIHVSQLLFVGCAFGLVLYGLQLVALVLHRRAPARAPRLRRGISILKPLCGLDDDLVANLECFAALDYAPYELLLGVRDRHDAAHPVAVAFARRFPRRVRVVLQRGTPGLNPKVNQLATLARAARHELIVVSDSNVRVAPGYLDEIAAHLEDPRVGLVTHPIAGIGEQRIGSLMDNLHLCASVGAGMIGAKRVVGKDIVVGKSMALRKTDLAALGGFEAFADVLAEDYLLGKKVSATLDKRVVVGKAAVRNVSERRDTRDFYRRYRRWSVMHRQCIGGPVYAAQ